jgi:son of sevenless-like protein
MVCLEILSGQLPFHGKDAKGVDRALKHGKLPDRFQSISDEMWSLMLKCWSKNPDARPPITAVRASLERIRSHSPGNVTPMYPQYRS